MRNACVSSLNQQVLPMRICFNTLWVVPLIYVTIDTNSEYLLSYFTLRPLLLKHLYLLRDENTNEDKSTRTDSTEKMRLLVPGKPYLGTIFMFVCEMTRGRMWRLKLG